jgi:hypothetical protein
VSAEASIALEFPKKYGLWRPAGSKRLYTLYGISLRSDVPLALEQQNGGGDGPSASLFTQALRGATFHESSDWYRNWCCCSTRLALFQAGATLNDLRPPVARRVGAQAGNPPHVARPTSGLSGALEDTFNYLHVAPDRLQRQFNEASSLANSVRFTKVYHSRVAGNLPEVRDAILPDVCNPHEEATWGA